MTCILLYTKTWPRYRNNRFRCSTSQILIQIRSYQSETIDNTRILSIGINLLEPRQFKNNLTMFESKLILRLPPFFTHCVGEGKRR